MSGGAARLDFVVIGAQKCATTWLYECLRDHPGIFVPRHKREVWYLGGDLYQERGARWYFALLDGAHAGQVVGDVSVDYLFDPRACEALAVHAPAVKLIACLRDPVERAVSAYFWAMRTGELPILPLDEGIEIALHGSARDGAASLYRQLIERSCYAVQLRRYLARFTAQQLAIVFYEQLAAEPRAALARVYAFVGADAGFEPRSLARRPKRNTFTRWLDSVERSVPPYRLTSRVTHAIGEIGARLHLLPERPQLDPVLRRELMHHFEPHNAALARLVRDLPGGESGVLPGWLGSYA